MATGNSRIICGTEKEWGDGIYAGSNPIVLRRTNFKVEPSRPELTSGEMRSDPFRAPSRLGSTEIKGEFGFEPIPGHHDDILAAMLHNEWGSDNKLMAGSDFRPRSLFLEHRTLGKHILYRGVVMEKLSLTFSPDELVKAAGNFLAKDRTEPGEGSIPETNMPPASTDVAPVSWDGEFMVGGIDSDIESKLKSNIMTSLTLDIARTINLRKVLGSKDPTAAVASKFEVTGSMTMRPTDAEGKNLWEKFHDESHISLKVTIYGGEPGSNRKFYTFDLPKLLLTNAPEDLSDPEDLLIEIPFVAEVGPEGVPLIITKSA
jgi:hypothetical protein